MIFIIEFNFIFSNIYIYVKIENNIIYSLKFEYIFINIFIFLFIYVIIVYYHTTEAI